MKLRFWNIVGNVEKKTVHDGKCNYILIQHMID